MAEDPKKKILVVDDNPAFCQFMKDSFGEEFELFVSSEGEDGLRKCQEVFPDLVLLDVNMPGISGVDFLARMSRTKPISRIPVLVISATDYNGITESLIRRSHNVVGFMTKLTSVESLRARILEATGGK